MFYNIFQVEFMKVNGKMMFAAVKALKNLRMETLTLESFFMAKPMEQVHTAGQTESHLKVNGSTE